MNRYNQQTIDAIKHGIRKYDLAALTGDWADSDGNLMGSREGCKLCQLHPQCMECPIGDKTGENYCGGTPWYGKDDRENDAELDTIWELALHIANGMATPEERAIYKRRCAEMADFMRDLLPKEEPNDG